MDSQSKRRDLSDVDEKLASSNGKASNASVRVLATDSTTSLGNPVPRADTETPSECGKKDDPFDRRRKLTGDSDFRSRVEEKDVEIVSPQPGHSSGQREEFVEGGLRGWATVIGAMILQFTGFGYVNGFGVFQDYYVREYLPSYSSSQISWIGSVQIFLTMSMGLLVGRCFDRGYFVHMAIAGSVLVAFALFMLSLTKPDKYYQIFLSQGLMLGVGSGLTYIPTLSLVSHHFRSPGPRAVALGLVASGSSLGGLVHPIMLNNLFYGKHAIGFGRSVRASAGLVLGMELLAIAMVRTRYGKGKGLAKPWNREGPGSVHSGGAHVEFRSLLKKFAMDAKYLSMLIGMALYAQGLFFPIFYLQLKALIHGLDSTFAFYTIAILNGSSVIGRILPGFLVRHFKLGVLNMLLFCNFVCAILIFAMLGVKTVGSTAAFAVLYGVFSGAMISLLAPNLVLLSDHPSEIGARMGVCFAFTGVGALIGNPINGALLTERFVWWRPIVYSGVICLAGSASAVVTKVLTVRGKKENLQIKRSTTKGTA